MVFATGTITAELHERIIMEPSVKTGTVDKLDEYFRARFNNVKNRISCFYQAH